MNNFRKFYNDNKGQFFGYLLRRSGDYHLAADIMQESFTRYIEQYGKREPIVSLLYTIGRNLLNDTYRRQRADISFEEDKHIGKGTPDEESSYMIREESRRVLSAMQQLSPNETDILSLAVGSDLSYRQIAELTGTSEANIKVIIHRSRQKLKKILSTGEP